MTSKPLPIPDEFLLDDRTWYLLRHHRTHFTHRELTAERWLLLASKEWGATQRDNAVPTTFYQKAFAEILAADPDLAKEIGTRGARAVLLDAVDRVVRDHGDEIRWNLCPRCAGLCRAPFARQCFRCGHDWHNLPAKDQA